MTNLDLENFPMILSEFITQNNLSTRHIASAITCSEPTINRLLQGETFPTDTMLQQTTLLMQLGYYRYFALSTTERETISAAMGAVGGGVVGISSVTTVVAASGSVAGLSAAGMTSGLAAMGAVIGGGMAAGIIVAATIPLACVGAGYGLIQLTKHFVSEQKLNNEELDPTWEIPKG